MRVLSCALAISVLVIVAALFWQANKIGSEIDAADTSLASIEHGVDELAAEHDRWMDDLRKGLDDLDRRIDAIDRELDRRGL